MSHEHEHEPSDAMRSGITESGVHRRLQAKAFAWLAGILAPVLVASVGKLYSDAREDRERITKIETVIEFFAETQKEMRGDIKELLAEIRK